METLSQQQQAMIPIAAFASIGDMEKLNEALNRGLDKGLTINEIKALLVQTYAYAGFPRSLNALGAFMSVLDERKSQGIQDAEGISNQIMLEENRALEQGGENQTKLVGQPVTGALFDFSPEIDRYLKAHLFGDIFSNNVLSWRDREIATLSMLSAMTGTENQLESHVSISLNIGVTHQQLRAIEKVLSNEVSQTSGQKLSSIL